MTSELSGAQLRSLYAHLRAFVHDAAPDDLNALGVDLPDYRWQAACVEIRRARIQGLLDARADIIELLGLAHYKLAARRAKADGPTASAQRNELHQRLVADAAAWMKRTFAVNNATRAAA